MTLPTNRTNSAPLGPSLSSDWQTRERGKLPPKVLLPMLRDKLCSDHPSGRIESVMLRFSFNFIHDLEVEKGSRLANFLVVVQLIYAPRWQLYNIIHVFPLPVHGPYGHSMV